MNAYEAKTKSKTAFSYEGQMEKTMMLINAACLRGEYKIHTMELFDVVSKNLIAQGYQVINDIAGSIVSWENANTY